VGNGGWYGTNEEWNRIEAPLKLLDSELDRFARKHRLRVTKNLEDWPERSLVWGNDVRCLIHEGADTKACPACINILRPSTRHSRAAAQDEESFDGIKKITSS
jgi:hypothetical protein